MIDGQQRLSVIYQAFAGDERQNDAGRAIDFGRLCFVVNPDWSKDNVSRIVHRKPLDREFVPIKDILAADWKKKMPSQSKAFLLKITRCRNALRNYPVPIVTVKKASLKEIGEVFVRVNSQGMRITSVDKAIAMMGTVDVRAMAEQIRLKVRESDFSLTAIDPILMGFNLVSEKPSIDSPAPKLDAMAQKWSKRLEHDAAELKRFKHQWARYSKAFLSAVDYIRQRFPVHAAEMLPSINMLSTLSVFFCQHAGQPDKFQAGEIRKWFWATGVGKRYSGGGYHKNIVSDSTFFQSLAEGKRRFFTFKDFVDPVLELQGEEYNSGSARTRAFFCLLAAHKPLYLDDGQPIPLDDNIAYIGNRKHRHHIFPQAQLRPHFHPRFYNSLCNVCFLVSRDNQIVGSKLPRNYLAVYRDAGHALFNKVMKSHLIPFGEGSGVWQDSVKQGFKEFRARRLALICKAFESEAGIKLFRRS